MGGKAYDLAVGVGDAILSAAETAFFPAKIRLRREVFESRFDFTDVVDGDPEVADASLRLPVLRLEDRDIVEAVAECDVSCLGAAELAHRKVGGVKTRQNIRAF